MANFESVPQEVVEKILSYLSYSEVCYCSLVNRKFNWASRRILKNGFLNGEKYFAECQNKLRAQLPCCEATRLKHPLGKFCREMLIIDEHLSLLKPDFMKYADSMMCFFVPGMMLDTCLKRLRFIDTIIECYITKRKKKEENSARKRKIRNKSVSCPYSKNHACHVPSWEDHEDMNFYKTALKYEPVLNRAFPSEEEEKERKLAMLDRDLSTLWYKIATKGEDILYEDDDAFMKYYY